MSAKKKKEKKNSKCLRGSSAEKKEPSRALSFSHRRHQTSSLSSASASVEGQSCPFLQEGRYARWRTWGNTGRNFRDKMTSWKFTLLNTSLVNKQNHWEEAASEPGDLAQFWSATRLSPAGLVFIRHQLFDFKASLDLMSLASTCSSCILILYL